MNLVRTCRNNSRAVFLVTAVLTLAGFVAMFQLPSNIYPELNFPRIMVLVKAGDLSPDTMLLTSRAPSKSR
jgi:multidrug efflux pump subunit AcrB